MAHRPAQKLPSLTFLDEVERAFGIRWPAAFRSFCRAHAGEAMNVEYPSLTGRFLIDLKSLEDTNRLVGEGSWGDVEKAITGRRKPKPGQQLYLDVLPFYVRRRDVFGFDTSAPGSDKVVLWSVHTTVHDYPTFAAWLAAEGRRGG